MLARLGGTPFALGKARTSISLKQRAKDRSKEVEMKKLVITLAVVGVVALVASQALACGPWGWGGWGPRSGYYGASTGGAYQSFLNDTAQLRQELAAKQGEYNALMAQPNPDPKRTAQVSQEIAGLQEQIQSKAQSSGMAAPGPYAYGPHRGWMCW
jgi:zinc resistance-associated protein